MLMYSELDILFAYKDRYDRENKRAPKGTIVLRKGLSLKCDPASVLGFQAFSFRSMDSVMELTMFLEQECDRFLDIGGYHGLVSLAICRKKRRVQCVVCEPSPKAMKILMKNVALNGFEDRITACQVAVSSKVGSLAMGENKAVGYYEVGLTGKTAPSTTADKLCESLNFQPDLIKIDTEGHDLDVVLGMQGILRQLRPTVFLELHPGMMKPHMRIKNIKRIQAIFDGLQYKVYNLGMKRVEWSNLYNMFLTHLILKPR